MEPAVGKRRLWSYVRAALFMARNGKRRLLLSMHLLGANNSKRRGTKAVSRAVANLLSFHHAHHRGHHANAYALRRRDYEFSCTNSPAADPAAAASSSSSSSSRRRLAYFPCLGAVAEEAHDYGYGYQYDGHGSLSLPGADNAEPPLAKIDYYAAASSPGDLDLAPGDEEAEEYGVYACAPSASASPALLLPGAASGEFSVRVSNYSSEDEGVGNQAVDDDAEEFIRRFYDQLRRQNTVAISMLPYYVQQETIAAA